MKSSIIIVSFFVLGVLSGYFEIIPLSAVENDISFYVLCCLMFCVGLSLGNDSNTLKRFTRINPRFYLLPVATIVGTLAGCAIISLLFPGRSALESMAVGSGFGYYSLSSIFITQYKGAELGTIALLSNIIREIMALLLAPLFVKYFGKLASISVGGATTMDTTLPIILKFSGKEFAVISVFHGFILDLSVPVLVALFCSL
ncbi:lysine exporter LysO family protein [Proteiniphilum sp. X52]|uniref:lysine exporter LysO family protein n=1 Tax=Proteiniphilum sp. X52 TaxID=2382159 RepID=UPI000F09A6F4|nr:lysine exporter LysO family protein [Proteiniphilum sp. X52]RNC65517.1 lysine exporter LysO family protein [Proteiniphilum sp. X52]